MNSNAEPVSNPGVPAVRVDRTFTFRWQVLLLFALAWGILNLAVGLYGGSKLPSQSPLLARFATSAFSILGTSDKQEEPIRFLLLNEATSMLQQQFVRNLPGTAELNHAAIKGVIDSLDDPYTYWLSPESAKLETESNEGQFGGIGARAEWDEDLAAVRLLEVFADSPAQAGNLQVGDLITKVDGQPVSELGMTGTVVRLRGPVDTVVEIQVQRETELFEVALTRAIIKTEILDFQMLGPGKTVGYLQFYTFVSGSGDQLVQALEEMQSAGMEGLILDLRGNSGGFLTEAVQVAGVFGGQQLVVTQRSRDGMEQEHISKQPALLTPNFPLAVLVDSDSASASELVAGAIQDWELGPLIGGVTLGKGSAQTRHPLSDKSELRVTTSLWYTPLDRTIQGVGLVPDIHVAVTPSDLEQSLDQPFDVALEVIIEALE